MLLVGTSPSNTPCWHVWSLSQVHHALGDEAYELARAYAFEGSTPALTEDKESLELLLRLFNRASEVGYD